jgi:hypothetical protein
MYFKTNKDSLGMLNWLGGSGSTIMGLITRRTSKTSINKIGSSGIFSLKNKLLERDKVEFWNICEAISKKRRIRLS